MSEYDGHQYVGVDLHRRRSVIVRQTEDGAQLSAVRILNDPVALGLQIEQAGRDPDVVLEATYGWYWATDVLQAAGARVHLAHPLGVKGFAYRRVKNDIRDAADLADLLRMGRLPEAWIAPPHVRELRELVRYRAKLVALRSGLHGPAPEYVACADWTARSGPAIHGQAGLLPSDPHHPRHGCSAFAASVRSPGCGLACAGRPRGRSGVSKV